MTLQSSILLPHEVKVTRLEFQVVTDSDPIPPIWAGHWVYCQVAGEAH